MLAPIKTRFMADTDLIELVTRKLASGVSEEKVRADLITKGYSAGDINGAFAILKLEANPLTAGKSEFASRMESSPPQGVNWFVVIPVLGLILIAGAAYLYLPQIKTSASTMLARSLGTSTPLTKEPFVPFNPVPTQTPSATVAVNTTPSWSARLYSAFTGTPAPSPTAPTGSASPAATPTTSGQTLAAAPSVSLSADAVSIRAGQTVTLAWTSEHASSCESTGGFPTNDRTHGNATVHPVLSTSYVVICTGPGGTAKAPLFITVTPDVPTPTPTPVPPTGPSSVNLSVNPESVLSGGSLTLSWSTANISSCTASGNWTGTKELSGSQTFTNITTAQSFTLTCKAPLTTITKNITVPVTTPATVPPSPPPSPPPPAPVIVPVPPVPPGSYAVYPGCQAPATSYANTIYVDPAHGSDTGDGTQATPYKTLETVLAQNKLKTDTHVVMLPGDHGFIFADSYSNTTLSNASSGWVWLDFQPGATADWMDIRSMHRWLITNAVVSRAPAGRTLLSMGSSGNMVIADSQLYTAKDSSGWTIDQWLNDANSGISGDDSVCVSLLRNRITNVRFGIAVFSRVNSPTPSDNSIKVLMEGNVIKNFSADGIRPNGTDITIHNNGIYDAYVSGPDGDWNHDDGIQGFATGGAVYGNVIIDHNWVQESTGGPNRALYSSLQGISSFDGVFTDSRVTNNVVLVSAPHGISWYNVRNFTIDHNTIANITNNGNPTWVLMINSDSSDVVSNNTGSSFSGGPGSTVTLINNVEVPDPAAVYTTFDPASNQYNFTPKPGSILDGLDVGAQHTSPVTLRTPIRGSGTTLLASAAAAPVKLGLWATFLAMIHSLLEALRSVL
ncbi:MAG: putative glycoside hydrolase [Parcubacteria group bacterium]|nr:putative glycoside hydrolase [Parcubacteria group bacterium]